MILLNGFIAVIISCLIVSLLGFAIYGLFSIPNEMGFAAVFDFIISCLSLVVAVANLYYLGRRKQVRPTKKGSK